MLIGRTCSLSRFLLIRREECPMSNVGPKGVTRPNSTNTYYGWRAAGFQRNNPFLAIGLHFFLFSSCDVLDCE